MWKYVHILMALVVNDLPTMLLGVSMLSGKYTVQKVGPSADPILRNLFELYLHDMAEWFEFDTSAEGNYSFPTGQEIWDKGVDVYFVYSEEIPIAFGLVGLADKYDKTPGMRDMDEFFVVRRYRRSGLGREFANFLWQQYPDPWLVRVYQRNLPAVPFWRSAIAAYTDGSYDEQVTEVNDRSWSYFRFNSGDT